MRLEWSPEARAHLLEIRAFVDQHTDGGGDVVTRAVVLRAARILDHPRAGRIVPEFPLSGAREVLLGKYRIIYAVGDSRIVIMAVIHGARDTRGR